MKKLFIMLLIGMISSTLFGQSNFYPIGAKWVYQDFWNIPPHGEQIGENTDVFFSEKDTTIKGLNLRKIVYSRNNTFIRNYFFQISTNNASLFYDDTLRLMYPFNLKIGDTATVEYPALDVDYPETKFVKFRKYKAVCTTVTSDSISSTKINSFKLEVVKTLDLKFSYFFGNIVYNDLSGKEDWSWYKKGSTRMFFLCEHTPTVMPDFPFKMKFTYGKVKNENGKWELSNSLYDSDFISSKINLYPNPAKDYFFVEGNATNYQIKSLHGSLLADGILPQNGKIDVNNFINGVYILILSRENQFLLNKSIIILK
jgi:hypothetical protein